MDRRLFLKSVSGAAAAAALAKNSTARAATAPAAPSHSVPLFVTCAAMGGWDVSIFCDPKSGAAFPINAFTSNDYVQAGPFTLAPGSLAAVQFFQRYYNQIMLINGMYAETNAHDIGAHFNTSGQGNAGFPTFGALASAALGPSLGLTFLSNGGYDETAHEVAKTLVTSSLSTAMSSTLGTSPAFTTADTQVIASSVAARLKRRQALAQFALRQQNMALLSSAREGWSLFPGVLKTVADLQANVPLVQGVTGSPGAAIDNTNPMFLAIQFGLAGYVNNATISLNLQYGSFDQHSGFAQHHLQIDSFFVGLDYLWRAAAYLGITSNVMMFAGSDFSRTPYNIAGPGDTGKGHWQDTTSAIFMGAHVPGGTLIGQSTSDATFAAMPVNLSTLKVSASGTVLTREMIHNELRRVAGILNNPIVKKYPLALQTGTPVIFT